MEAAQLQATLVAQLERQGALSDPRIAAAFRAVPRHLFLPDVPVEQVYSDEAIPTRRRDGIPISSSSQPAVMAIMLEQLDLRPGDRVLEVGAGTGYNAALMAHLVGPSGQVTTMDIDEDIVADARAHLAATGAPQVQAVIGDGALGRPEGAPYDRIILTVGAWDISPAWIQQLRPGGRLVLPLALRGFTQKLVAFDRVEDYLVSASVREGSFMPLRGAMAGPQLYVRLGEEPELLLGVGTPRPLDAECLYALLTGPYREYRVPGTVSQPDLNSSLGLWLALHSDAMCLAAARGEAARREAVPNLLWPSPTSRVSVGLLGDDALCLLARSSNGDQHAGDPGFALTIRSYGSDEGLVQDLADLLEGWQAAGKPATARLSITAFPRELHPEVDAGDAIIDKPHTRLVLNWS